MNADDERLPGDLDTGAFLTKWMPQPLAPSKKSEFLMDLERLVLARTLEMGTTPPRAATGPDGFDWSGEGAVAVKRVCALAIYKSAEGDLVVRQEGPKDEEDTVVVIPPGFVGSVIDAIQRQLRESVFPPVLSRVPER